MTNLNFELNSIKWWEQKNEGKERCIEYDLDFESEMIHHISQGDILEVNQDDN
jgi:hypothetical protein